MKNPLCIIIALILLGYPDQSFAKEEKLTITGSSTLAPLAAEIVKQFEVFCGDVRIDVQTGGSSRGIADIHRGLADLGMSSRPLYEAEQLGTKTYTLAHDAIAFIVHKSNPITSLSRKQLFDIYTGHTTNWRELGGKDALITVIGRAKGRSELDIVSQFLGIHTRDMKADIIAGETQQANKLISSNKNTITYTSAGAAHVEVERKGSIKIISLDGIPPTDRNIRVQKYPLVRPLLLVAKSNTSITVQKFIDFALSSQVHTLVRKQSFVPPQ